MGSIKQFFRVLNTIKSTRHCHSETVTENKRPKKPLSHAKAINSFFRQNKELNELKQYIPEKYFQLDRTKNSEHLYLICQKVAKTIASYVIPTIDSSSNHVISETNAGLGLVTTELLEGGVSLVRLYECCPEFRVGLKDFGSIYPGRVELFTKDIFHLSRYAYFDKCDHGNRVESLLRSVPKLSWTDEPVITIIGTMSTLSFIKYLIESLALQNGVVNYGRIQLFAIMKPKHFAVLAATPKDNLAAYQKLTILFNLIFDYELLDKFPRNLFLPWEPPPKKTRLNFYPANLEPEKMYLVKINFKKTLPVLPTDLLPLSYFIKQFYGKGNNRVIPTIEKWVPGCGLNIIVPKQKHSEYFTDIDIFTKFRELTPNEILSIFKEMINYPAYSGSPFTAMIDNELLKIETIETSLSESPQHEKNVAEQMEEKFDIK